MSIWNDVLLHDYCNRCALVAPFDAANVNPASIDLRLGTSYRLPAAMWQSSAAEKQTIINMKANGMKSVDIADQMQLNESTVRSIIRRASIPAVHTNGATKESA